MDLHPAVDRLFRSYIGYAELLSLVSGDGCLALHTRNQLAVVLEFFSDYNTRRAFCRRVAALSEEFSPIQLSIQADVTITISGCKPGQAWAVLLKRSGELLSGALGLISGDKPSQSVQIGARTVAFADTERLYVQSLLNERDSLEYDSRCADFAC